jgi:hypothetical protein
MESLESKLDRLTPDQRKEIEDFVDFLMRRSGNSHESPNVPGAAMIMHPSQSIAPPPLTLSEPVHVSENSPGKGYESLHGERTSLPIRNEEQVTSFQEIIVGGDDHVIHGYLDYGEFEQPPSPAMVAVKNVKEKLQQREEREKPEVSLDWIG